MNDAPKCYDVVFFGSDQIWNPAINEGVDQVYLGQMPKGHAKFYTYAVSMGRLDLFQGKVEEEYRKYISSFDGLSVRKTTMQKNFYTILRKNNNDRAKTILGVAGLENRLADAKDNIEFKEINYQGVRERLDRYKERSMEWIQKCLDDEMVDGGID